MPARLENFGYGSRWQDFSTDYYEGFNKRMTDYHMHDYYEISLILSGNVKILLSDRAEQNELCRLVMLRPRTPHYVVCEPDKLYKRHNLLFSESFLSDYAGELHELIGVFGRCGSVIPLSREDAESFARLIVSMRDEADMLRRRLLLLYFISLAKSKSSSMSKDAVNLPTFVSGALDYVSEHYCEKIVASDIAWKTGVSRTTLMTGFKKYTGLTLCEYITNYRLRHAIALLRAGEGEPETARLSGFSDSSNMIRAFKKHLGMTPLKYLASKKVGIGGK